MKRRKYYLVSILSVVVALGFHCVGRAEMTDAMRLKAISVQSAVEHHGHVTPNLEAKRSSNRGELLCTIGYPFTLCCLICLTAALFRREPGLYGIPLVLLFFDIIMCLILV